MLYAVIMAGGSGTRFWPASRSTSPKQLLALTGEQSMIQSTVARLGSVIPAERLLVVTNERLVEAVRRQLPQLSAQSVIGEPCKRDTAPCVGLAAAWVCREDREAIMVVMPADHLIQPSHIFQQAIEYAATLVEEKPSRLVTFGIRPSYPAESFGYIERDELIDVPQGTTITPATFRVKQFREKPNAEVAREYVNSGSFFWNSGIFVWKAQTILTALQQYEPEMYAHLLAIADSIGSSDFAEVFQHEFAAIKGVSIDYAVMERANEVVVIEAPFGWDDVGSWQALARLSDCDENGNTLIGRTLCLDTTGTIVRTNDEHLIATLGIRDCIVVRTENATLVASKHEEERVRALVKRLEENGWNEYL